TPDPSEEPGLSPRLASERRCRDGVRDDARRDSRVGVGAAPRAVRPLAGGAGRRRVPAPPPSSRPLPRGRRGLRPPEGSRRRRRRRRRRRLAERWVPWGLGVKPRPGMGLLFAKLWSLFGSQEHKVIIVGLDNAGKTTILYQFLMNEVVHTSPTIGSNVEEIVVKNTHFLMWDIGGQESLRSSWNTYYSNTEV
uniref:ADP ribosylation factor like GTPase 5B n=1 Tax=Accipiter nisus TaxID=211598 RepID=A0A8B9MDV7_9AVES